MSSPYDLETETARRVAELLAAATGERRARAAALRLRSGWVLPGRLAGLASHLRAALPWGSPAVVRCPAGAACCPAA